MALKLMYITNRVDIAIIAEEAGVDRIFIDMEYIGKDLRQGGLDSVKNHHSIADIKKVREVITKAELLVRVNPIHDATEDYYSSEEEIDHAIESGADIIMLPFFKTADEVRRFIKCVNGRVKVLLLLETPEAVDSLSEILSIPGIDEIHIGLNDLSLGYGKPFMFELLADGTVESICNKLRESGIPFGFGGVASIGTGILPAENVLKEHYRLGSSMVILSRSFCDVSKETDVCSIRKKFNVGIRCLRAFEKEIQEHSEYFAENQRVIMNLVNDIVHATSQAKK